MVQIRTTVLGPSHALVQQVRTLHEMALSTPVPAPSQKLNVDRAKAPLAKDPAVNHPPRVKSRNNGLSFESDELNRGFVDSSMLSESTQKRQGTQPERRHTSTHPMSERRGDSDGAPTTRERFAITNSSERDTSNFNFSETEIPVPPYRVPRTSEPIEKFHDTTNQWDNSDPIPPSMLASSGYEVSDKSPNSRLRDLNLESTDERGALPCHVSDAEECCLIGDIGGDSDRATSRMLSMLERDENFLGDVSRTVSSHKITVVQPFEVGFEISGPHKSRRTTSRSRAMANGGSSVYSHSLTPEDEIGLAPLGDGWFTSKGSTAGHALTKSILDNPDDHLGTIYEAAGRHLKV